MQYKENEIKKGIKLHEIQTDKFKTNLIAVFLSMPITKENVTKNIHNKSIGFLVYFVEIISIISVFIKYFDSIKKILN